MSKDDPPRHNYRAIATGVVIGLLLIALALALAGCGVTGMTRAMQPVVEGFDKGECVSREIRQGQENPNC